MNRKSAKIYTKLNSLCNNSTCPIHDKKNLNFDLWVIRRCCYNRCWRTSQSWCIYWKIIFVDHYIMKDMKKFKIDSSKIFKRYCDNLISSKIGEKVTILVHKRGFWKSFKNYEQIDHPPCQIIRKMQSLWSEICKGGHLIMCTKMFFSPLAPKEGGKAPPTGVQEVS